MNVAITSLGHYLPNRIIDNNYLQEVYKIESQSIFKRTGILERRYVEEGITNTNMVVEAVLDCLRKVNRDIDSVDCLIVGTLSPDYFFPSTAVSAINQLGARAWGFDISAACSGFCYGLHLAKSMIVTGAASKIVVVGAEKMSATLNAFDYKTGILFGDGAGAVLVEEASAENEWLIKNSECIVEADDLNDVYFKTPFNSKEWAVEKFELSGNRVYKNGVSLTILTIQEYLRKNDLALEDVQCIIPHQANIRMIKEIAKGLGVRESFFLSNIKYVGNTGAASIPLAMSLELKNRTVSSGDRYLLVSFGSGYTLSVIELIKN